MRAPFWRREFTLTRTSAHTVFAVLVWPALTMVGASMTIATLPYFSVPLHQAVGAAIGGTLLSAPDLVIAGVVVFGLSRFIFGRLGAESQGRTTDTMRLALEPFLMLGAVAAGVSVWYPAVVGQAILFPLASVPAGAVVALLFVSVAIGACVTAARGKRLRLAVALISTGLLGPVPLSARSGLEAFLGHPPEIVLLGVDSVSYDARYPPFEDWVKARSGTWYEHAVSPGLLTNSVWASILTMQPVHAHGVFHTFQPLPAVPPALIASARAQGYRTVSVFTDQFTCAVGSRAGFDDDRSGPVGWRQLLLAIIADNSLIVPIIKPVLPSIWPSLAPPNHAGTFTYDVRRQIRGILRAGAREQRTLVAAHVNYAHHPAYPATGDLSWEQLWWVARAPAGVIRDRSFDWQDRDLPSDPLKLHPWKLKHVHEVIASEVDAAAYLGGGRRLVVFSDHGDRAGLGVDNFGDRRYFHVPLATFGVAPRCPSEPISLIDIGSLVGLSTAHADPSVEFTVAPQEQWSTLVKTARLRWYGDVELDQHLMADIFKGLRRHEPWGMNQRFCGSALRYLPTTTYLPAVK